MFFLSSTRKVRGETSVVSVLCFFCVCVVLFGTIQLWPQPMTLPYRHLALDQKNARKLSIIDSNFMTNIW
jgi:hypothetical protein